MPASVLFLEPDSGYTNEVDHDLALSAALRLISTIRLVRKKNSRVVINSPKGIRNCSLAANWTLSTVLAGNKHIEEWTFLRTLADRSPLSSGFEEMIGSLGAYEAATKSGDGSDALLWAWLLQTGTASVHAKAEWKCPWVVAVCNSVLENGEIVTNDYDIRNISHSDHASEHEDWIKSLGVESCPSSTVLWNDRAHRYPGLRFLPRVQKDFDALSTSGAPYKQALETLKSLNEDVMLWRESASLIYSTKVADGEHDNRKRYCYVRDEDGKEYCFDAHAYFTGSFPGRVHFRIDRTAREVVVAYVGAKLERSIGN